MQLILLSSFLFALLQKKVHNFTESNLEKKDKHIWIYAQYSSICLYIAPYIVRIGKDAKIKKSLLLIVLQFHPIDLDEMKIGSKPCFS